LSLIGRPEQKLIMRHRRRPAHNFAHTAVSRPGLHILVCNLDVCGFPHGLCGAAERLDLEMTAGSREEDTPNTAPVCREVPSLGRKRSGQVRQPDDQAVRAANLPGMADHQASPGVARPGKDVRDHVSRLPQGAQRRSTIAPGPREDRRGQRNVLLRARFCCFSFFYCDHWRRPVSFGATCTSVNHAHPSGAKQHRRAAVHGEDAGKQRVVFLSPESPDHHRPRSHYDGFEDRVGDPSYPSGAAVKTVLPSSPPRGAGRTLHPTTRSTGRREIALRGEKFEDLGITARRVQPAGHELQPAGCTSTAAASRPATW